MKRGKVVITPGKPLEFAQEEETDSKIGESLESLGESFIAHSRAASELLKGKYAHLADVAPRHLRERCDMFITRCVDGVFVRYDGRVLDRVDVTEKSQRRAERVMDGVDRYPEPRALLHAVYRDLLHAGVVIRSSALLRWPRPLKGRAVRRTYSE